MLFISYSLHFFLLDFNDFNLYCLAAPVLMPSKIYKDLLMAEHFKTELMRVGVVYGVLI